MTVEEIARAIDPNAKRGGGDNWSARCPAHDDKTPSLSVGAGDERRVLLKCHHGCGFEVVLAAAELTDEQRAWCRAPGDATQPAKRAQRSALDRPRPNLLHGAGLQPPVARDASAVAEYVYRDGQGVPRRRVTRYEVDGVKSFPVEHIDNLGNWSAGEGDGVRVIYRLPELMASAPEQAILLVEGEKDTDQLLELGLVATTTIGGAGRAAEQWQWPGVVEPLRGRQVIIIPDNDEPGRRYAEVAGVACRNVDAAVSVVELPGLADGEDASDFLSRHTRDDFIAAVANAMDFDAWMLNRLADDPTIVRLALDQPSPPPPALWEGRIVAGDLAVIYGSGGNGKSFIAAGLAMSVAAGLSFLGASTKLGCSIYYDAEERKAKQQTRFAKVAAGMGLSKPPLLSLYMNRDEVPFRELPQKVRRVGPALLVIDSWSATFAAQHDNNDGGRVNAVIDELLSFGCTVLIIDHTAKPSKEFRGTPLPMGAIAKSNRARSLHYLEWGPKKGLLLRHVKNNDGPLAPTLRLTLEGDADSIAIRHDAVAAATKDQRDSVALKEQLVNARIEKALVEKGFVTSADLEGIVGKNLRVPYLRDVVTKGRLVKKGTRFYPTRLAQAD